MSKLAASIGYRMIEDLKGRGLDPYSMSDEELLSQKGVGEKVFLAMKKIMSERKFVEESIKKRGMVEVTNDNHHGIFAWARRLFA